MCPRNGIFLRNTALMLASIMVILTMAYPSAQNQSTKLGSIKQSLNSPIMEVDVVVVVATAVAVATIQVVVMVAVIKPITVESGTMTLQLRVHLSAPLAALANIRASGV